jgi:ubiquinone/menaquinone biosynthesis C-methylase UbiE
LPKVYRIKKPEVLTGVPYNLFLEIFSINLASEASSCETMNLESLLKFADILKKNMGLYTKYVLPSVIDFACKQNASMRQRIKVIPLATGNVLEIGVGSGLNIPIYNQQNVTHLTAIDPSKEIWKKNNLDIQNLPFTFSFKEAFAENIPEDNNCFDTVVITYSLCTISDTNKALEEVRRVLKPNGKLIFCEHGKAPDKSTQQWQNRINPLWKRLGGGCHLNKDIPFIIQENGFKMNTLEKMYIPGWKPASFNYWGTAKTY